MYKRNTTPVASETLSFNRKGEQKRGLTLTYVEAVVVTADVGSAEACVPSNVAFVVVEYSLGIPVV